MFMASSFRTSALSTGTRRSRGTDFIGPGFARIASQRSSGLSPTNNKQRSRVVHNDVDDRFSGGGRYAAAVLLGLQEVPVIRVEGLSKAKRRALALADNKIAQNAGWDREPLARELPELAELLIVENLDISITGFAPVEIDQIATDFEDDPSDPADTVDPEWTNDAALSRPGDLWELGQHRLLCGDARHVDDLARLLGRARAAMAFLDPPYNVRVREIVGPGQIKHSEFAIASGELPRTSFVEFLQQSLAAAAAVSRDGRYGAVLVVLDLLIW
jgi:hypothetical protein